MYNGMPPLGGFKYEDKATKFKYKSGSNDKGLGGCLMWLVLIIAVITFLDYNYQSVNAITTEAALERFYEMRDADEIRIVRQSNNAYFFGSMHYVTFELSIDGQRHEAYCESDFFSEMTCFMNSGG